jgi:hypothetical protein
MTAATGADPEEQLDSDEEYDFDAPGTGITVAAYGPTPTVPTVVSVVEVTEPAPTPEPTAPTPELATEPMVTALTTEPTEVPKPSAPIADISKESISSMDKATVQAHCKARGIDISSKGLVQLKRELSASLK